MLKQKIGNSKPKIHLCNEHHIDSVKTNADMLKNFYKIIDEKEMTLFSASMQPYIANVILQTDKLDYLKHFKEIKISKVLLSEKDLSNLKSHISSLLTCLVLSTIIIR
jgi:tmRNA-binding protein